jgi:hypothetical protein
MSYCISSGESFNMVLNYADPSDPTTWTRGKEVEEMRAVYKGWDPRYIWPISKRSLGGIHISLI